VDVADFDYELPAELIAQEAAARGASRLLVLHRSSGRLEHTTFSRLGDYLVRGDLLVLNDTKVFPARLLGRRVPSGGAVECLLTSRLPDGTWSALVHPGQKLKPGARVVFERDAMSLHGEILGWYFHGRRTVRLWMETSAGAGDAAAVDAAIDRIGHVPLPPYIHRADQPEDRERYQTVFAQARGSVAAPTAGLHFTRAQLDELAAEGIERATVTLHVGYGTFKPVRVGRIEDHVVDAEHVSVSDAAAAAVGEALRARRRVIAVGTTTTRALESLSLDGDRHVVPLSGETALFIHPGHRFQVVEGLITNFHLPRSSLLMLVAAFAGRDQVLAAYRAAVAERYRFYSYGDAMLIL
jgi:S-adenosylmethionine:tRNA ribosyltransferase-isomerase